MLNDSKECVILINEAKALNPEKDGGDQNEDGEDKSKGFILHNLLWFVEELKRTYTRQKQVHNYLQQQVDYLKSDNRDTTNKILSIQ